MDARTSTKSAFRACIVKSAPDVVTNEKFDRTVVRSYSAAIIAQATGWTLPIMGRSTVKYRIETVASRAEKLYKKPMRGTEGRCGRYTRAHIGSLSLQTGISPGYLPRVGTPFDFTALCRRLGRFLARSTSGFGGPDGSWLLRGGSATLQSLESSGYHFDSPGVYMPVPEGIDENKGLIGMILYAALECGVAVYSDGSYTTYVDNNRWRESVPHGEAALEAILRSVKLIIDSAELSGSGGAHFAAFLIGLHDVSSVLAHTDEGGYLCDVMRAIKLPAPNGVIAGSPPCCVQLPMPAGRRNSRTGYVGCVDTMLLTSAAMFAVSDPGVGVDSDVPWVSYRPKGSSWKNHYSQLTKQMGPLIEVWFKKICSGNKLSGGAVANVVSWFCSAQEDLFAEDTNKHLDHDGIYIPYWIEPSPILADCTAEVKSNAVCKVISGSFQDSTDLPMFGPDAKFKRRLNYMCVAQKWQKPRDCGYSYLYSLNASSRDGTAVMDVALCDSVLGRKQGADQLREVVMFPGVADAGAENSLASMTWTVDASGIYPPHMAAPSDEGVRVLITFELDEGVDPMNDKVLVDRLPRANDIVKVCCTHVEPDVREFAVGARRSFAGTRGLRRAAYVAGGMHTGFDDEHSLESLLDELVLTSNPVVHREHGQVDMTDDGIVSDDAGLVKRTLKTV